MKTGLELLRSPFPNHQISLLPKPLKKDSPKGKCSDCGGYHGLPAVHLEYVGHAALTDRLLDCDPNWHWEPLALKDGLPAFDSTGGLWIKLTVCGVSRLGYGNAENSSYKEIGSREKEVIGDALRNAAMRFGAALDLWHKGELHLPEHEETKTKAVTPEKKVIKTQEPKKPAPHNYALDAKLGSEGAMNLYERIIAGGSWTRDDITIYIQSVMKTEAHDLTQKQAKEFFELTKKTTFEQLMGVK